MRLSLSGFLSPDHINLNLQSRSENEAITEVAGLLREREHVRDFGSFCEELFTREKLSPTALGSGIAFPHARTDHVDKIVVAVGRSTPGIWFEKCQQNVRLIFVIGTPKESIREYLALLATLAFSLRREGLREGLMTAKTPEEFLAFFVSEG